MIARIGHLLKVTAGATAAAAGLLAASCAPQYSSPRQVAASNPSVTYKYGGDQDLLQANQRAATFCSQYQAAPRTAGFSNDPDGSKIVIFECVQTMTQMAPAQQFSPNLTYNYRTDSELLEASQNAQTYCQNNGSQPAVSNIATSANGNRTVTFQCGRP